MSLLHRDARQEPLAALSRFRGEFYSCLTARSDGLFELADAVLCADGPVRSLAELSLVCEHRRGHGGLYAAVARGQVNIARLQQALAAVPLPRAADGRLVLAVDVTCWLRPDAHTSPERILCHTYGRGKDQHIPVPGWPYSIICAPEAGRSSWWSGTDATPSAVDRLWQAYLRRFDIEHTFRLFKQTLGWTCPKIRSPEAADRWTWLILAAYAQLRLARPLAADLRRPWEKPAPTDRLTPARVRRDFRHIRPKATCPARAPKPSRPGPGRPPGRKNTRPTPRHDVHTVGRTDAAKPRTKKSTTPRPRRKG